MSIFADKARELLSRYRERTRDRRFLEATMAASALVATADGEVGLAELLSRDQVLDRVDALQSFDSRQAVEIFRGYADAIAEDKPAGVERALRAVAVVGDDVETAQLLLRVCCAIAKADAEFSAEEQHMIALICEALGAETVDLTP